MGKIKVLDDKTINQIAAGEVVERPVSVVKELVENAIDAGATSVSVEIKDGGISLIRVTDNGSGIEKDDIRTAFLRHATSKILNALDLITVKSLGFRGEALSSIVAVSQVELLTKVRRQMFGIRYVVSGGREEAFDEVGVPDGTTIIVRNLFFNTPARRKFLKSPATETTYITDLIERMILSHPDITFRYIVNGKEKLTSAGNNEPKQNIYSIFGRDISNICIPVSYDDEGICISGYIAKPEAARGNRNYELFFVNNRFIKSDFVSKAVEEAYKNYLMLHKYPFVVLYFNMPSEYLDVNVHPAKTEIRFLKENELYRAIVDTISEALSHKELIPEVKADEFGSVPIIVDEETVKQEVCKAPIIKEVQIKEIPHNESKDTKVVENIAPEPFESKKLEIFKEENIVIEDVKQESLFTEEFLNNDNYKAHKIIGQIFDTYWIVELEDKMYIIDQHAAHEKILYERLKKRIDNDDIFVQNLSPAIIISLSAAEEEVLNRNIKCFNELGFTVENFGGREYSITTVPVDLFGQNALDYFHDILDDLIANSKVTTVEAVKDRIATMACKAAIKGNMHISENEARALIDELLSLDNPYNCPHGRPTIVSYKKSEIEKMFKRIV